MDKTQKYLVVLNVLISGDGAKKKDLRVNLLSP